jgi:ketosteroid isomerase-like protein
MGKRSAVVGGDVVSGYVGSFLSSAEAVYTVTRFYRHLDDRDYEEITALMAPDGVWHRQGSKLSSKAQILEAMNKRSSTLVIHHLLSNMFADLVADGTAQVTGYMLVVRYDSGTPMTGPAPLSGVDNIRTIRAMLVPTAKGWRIQSMISDPISFAAK